ncbi:MAG: helix-turn-helix transcriptional regulator [Acholeplasmatales bacterium]|nr:helix-turn-helix transcriptional regulator [Acholeplasmatales bacterium]
MAKIDYADGILKLRAKLNLSQEELAKLLGVSFMSVNRWENDKYAPTKLVKVKLNQLFKEHNIEVKEANE